MTIKDLGYTADLEKYRVEQKLNDFEIGRVITEHKERYTILSDSGEFDAEITGNMRFTAKDRSDFPAVGDWVAFSSYDTNFAIIHKIFPRKSIIERQSIGHFGEIQIIAANIDFALIIQAVDRDFNINRVERYLTICYSAKVQPIIILSKTDLIGQLELERLIADMKSRVKEVPVIPISNQSKNGFEKLDDLLFKGKTYCFLGSSGVGKSTLINNLIGQEFLKTSNISSSTNKGRHTTSRRELNIIENGSILIDNPGMKEVGIADTSDGLEVTFDEIIQISRNCRFPDCTHTQEKGCAVIAAVEDGTIDAAFYENYHKMEREKNRFITSIADKRKKDKEFGKLCKEVMKYKKKNKF
ncbi:MAG: ribosome small subunit-dependent GTPase A [Tenuifilaceae bacterium]